MTCLQNWIDGQYQFIMTVSLKGGFNKATLGWKELRLIHLQRASTSVREELKNSCNYFEAIYHDDHVIKVCITTSTQILKTK